MQSNEALNYAGAQDFYEIFFVTNKIVIQV